MKNEITKELLLSKAFWQGHNPDLHICDHAFVQNQQPVSISRARKKFIRGQLEWEGYVDVGKPRWNLPIKRMAACAENLYRSGIPPVFSLVYDEFWQLLNKLDHYFKAALCHDYKVLPCFWVWVIDPEKGGSGWKPHRDRGLKSLFADNSPKALTAWIALSEATPLNGCMYILPMHLDGKLKDQEKTIMSFSDIRALPAKAGNAFLWNQYVYHWGAKSSPRAKRPRISIAFEVQRSDVPGFKSEMLSALEDYSLDRRITLICKQLLQYKHMYELIKNFESVAREILG